MGGKSKRRAVNATGRNKSEPFVQLRHRLLESPAWRSLNPCARAALIEFYSLYNGRNNGAIFMGIRTLAALLNVAPNTARKAIADLTERGFIKIKQKGSFSQKVKLATEWILTEHPVDDQLPDRGFMKWRPPGKIQNTVSPVDTVGISTCYRGPLNGCEKAAHGITRRYRDAH